MHIRDLHGKNVCLIGFGKENQATLRAIETYAPGASVTIADTRELIDVPKRSSGTDIPTRLGPSYLFDLDRFDLLIKTPGIPPCAELENVRQILTNPTQIFLDTIAESGSIVVGITGTKGKSTTSSLIAAMLQESGKDAHLVGNIGMPALDYLGSAKADTIFVYEMSSYQLMDLTTSPPVGVITSLFPDHLDYHGSYEAYVDAKKNIARFQAPGHVIFYPSDPISTKEVADVSAGSGMLYSESDAPVDLAEVHLIGAHNLRNIAGAWAAASYLGAEKAASVKAAKAFRGLPHRLQNLGMHDGIEWVDDAISTTPESTIAGIDALGKRLKTIIVGGKDRGYDFRSLAERIGACGIETVICLPESGTRIREAIGQSNANNLRLCDANTIDEAVMLAREHTETGKICLLSPASPSYNQFRNFEEKGEAFAEAVRKNEANQM